jgi:hypothetical protein
MTLVAGWESQTDECLKRRLLPFYFLPSAAAVQAKHLTLGLLTVFCVGQTFFCQFIFGVLLVLPASLCVYFLYFVSARLLVIMTLRFS